MAQIHTGIFVLRSNRIKGLGLEPKKKAYYLAKGC